MSSKEYVFVKQKTLYGRSRFYVVKKMVIVCEGGEKMNKESSKLVFVKTDSIPKQNRGKVGRDWKALFSKIPTGESLVLDKEFASGATVRIAVKTVNDELGEVTYIATQRTDEKEKTLVYVTRK